MIPKQRVGWQALGRAGIAGLGLLVAGLAMGCKSGEADPSPSIETPKTGSRDAGVLMSAMPVGQPDSRTFGGDDAAWADGAGASPSIPPGVRGEGADGGLRGANLDARATDAKPSEARLPELFDLTRLHRITITIAAADVPAVEMFGDGARVSCTVNFDGTEIGNVGIRQKGGQYRGPRKLGAKPGFSLKFDEFVNNQTLLGKKKLLLNNAGQDLTFVGEHLVYEVYRRAGLPGPLTAHALVTVNGFVEGIYVMKEAIDKQFLTRNFGSADNDGNLYEGSYLAVDKASPDFVTNPEKIELKDEVAGGRKRDDLVALATVIGKSADAVFETEVSKRMDLGNYITTFAIDGVVSWRDSYSWNLNNYYLYDVPKDKRFVFLPSGADNTFMATGAFVLADPFVTPRGRLALAVRRIPALDAKYRAEVRRIGSDAVWNVSALLERMAAVATLIKAAPDGPAVNVDKARFEMWRVPTEAFIKKRGTSGVQ